MARRDAARDASTHNLVGQLALGPVADWSSGTAWLLTGQRQDPTPGTGDVVRIRGDRRTVIASGLDFPTALTVGPDGNLYISNHGFGPLANTSGEVLKVNL